MGENIFSKTITIFALLYASVTQQALGQLVDNFSDGNFNNAPAWIGTTSNYIVNGAGRLQLNAGAAGSSYLSLAFAIPQNHDTQWEFVINHNFSGSSQNFTRIYLMSDSQDPLNALNGYFLQFGETGSNDPIDLFRQTGGTAVSICRGTLGFVAGTFTISVRITRSSVGVWEILADNTGGTNFTSQATVVDNTFNSSAFFIVRSTYTIGNISNFSFDDFNITTTQAPDIIAPSITSVSVVNPSEIQLNFSEPLNTTNALDASSFVLNDTIATTSASLENNNTSIKLTFGQPMLNGRIQKIHFPTLTDAAGNALTAGDYNFLFFDPIAAQTHDIIINEVYADPSPSIGLPEYEFVEIFNRSEHPFQLEGWQLTDGTTTATLSAKILLPGEFLTVTPNAAGAAYAMIGPATGVSTFPSLNNSGDHLQLKSPDGTVIDDLTYALTWYHDEDKDGGGFSLELIDPTNFCSGLDNWKASTNTIGGTPGSQNSVFQIIPDVIGPKLIEVMPKAANIIALKFNERLAEDIPALTNFLFPYPIEKISATFSGVSKTEIDLAFVSDLDSVTTYTISLENFFDCPGNTLQTDFATLNFKMDMIRPEIVNLKVVDMQNIEIEFSEKILAESISPQSISPEEVAGTFTASLIANQKVIAINFSSPLVNGKEYSIAIGNLTDHAGNLIAQTTQQFRFFEAAPVHVKDIVINELLADQSPVVGLPESEFVELFNRSSNAINISGWTITDGASTATLPDKIVLPSEHLILCPAAFASSYAAFGTTIGLSPFPSLNNGGDMIKLISNNGMTVDSIRFSSAWYQHDDKEDGGWSIERINPGDFCGEIENWKASEAEPGGTPGKQNSIFALTNDFIPPDLLSVSVHSGDSLVVHFDERISLASLNPLNFVFEPNLLLDTIFFVTNDRREVGVKLDNQLDSITRYSINLRNVFDCPGNALPSDSATFAFRLDNIAPAVTEVREISESQIVVAFSEKIKWNSETINHFGLDGVSPTAANLLEGNWVELFFDPPLINGKRYSLNVSGISDLAANIIVQKSFNVQYFKPQPVFRKDIIITEIFADPTPIIGLPETEYIEIFNRSENPVDLKNWALSDNSQNIKLKSYILLPKEYLTLTTSSKAFQFESVLGISSFPTLTNTGESLVLKDTLGNTIDSVLFSIEWYRDSEKSDGGWSLELIDPNNICSEGENWTSSVNEKGGTPGKANSVLAEKPDLTAPQVLSVFALNADTVIIDFNEKLNAHLPLPAEITMTPPVGISSVVFFDQSMRSYIVTLNSQLTSRVRYKLELSNVSDCAGNIFIGDQLLEFALPEIANPGDIVINELLFNPRPTGVDFVEIYNRSQKFINLKNWTLANLINDTIVSRKILTTKNLIFEPGEILAITADPIVLQSEYLQTLAENTLRSPLPTLPDEDGSLILLSDQGLVIDTLLYNEEQHSPFIKDSEGVSLERVDQNSPSSNPDNWQSASANSGYATRASEIAMRLRTSLKTQCRFIRKYFHRRQECLISL
jgi:hypothetical protein